MPSSRTPLVVACATAAAVLLAYFVRVQQVDGRIGRVFDLVVVGGWGFALTWAATHPVARRRRAAFWSGALALGALLAWLSLGRFTSFLASEDAVRAFGCVLFFGGAGLGLRAAGNGAWRVLTFGPFLLLLLCSGAWLPTMGIAWTMVLAMSLGDLLAQRSVREAAETTPLAVRITVGLSILAPGVLLLGSLGMASAPLLVFAAAALTIGLRRVVRANAWVLVGALRTPPPTCASQALGRGAIVGVFVVYLIAALAPETGWDATALRVAAPARWLEQGMITALPQLAATHGVSAGEMLALWTMPLAGHAATKLLAFAAGLLILHGLCRDVWPRTGLGSLLALPLLGSSLVWWQMCAGLVDLLQALHFFAMALAFQRWRDHHGKHRAGWLLLAAVCAGGATAIKWNGGIALVILTALVLVSGGGLRRTALPLAAGFLPVILPWVVRSAWLTGNPVFPFANGWFGSPLAPTDLAHNPYGDGSLWSLPIDVFLSPARFSEQGGFHPGLLALVPLAIGGLRAVPGRWWLATALGSFGLWALTEQNTRYGIFVAIFVTAALGSGVTAWHARLPGFERGLLVWTLVVLGVGGFGLQRGLGGAHYWNENCDALLPIEVVCGTRSAEDFLQRHVETFAAGRWLRENANEPIKIWVRPPLRGDNLYLPGTACRRPHGIQPLMRDLHVARDVTHILDSGTVSYPGFTVRQTFNGVRLLTRPQ